ncbi:MAG: penicillin-binding protein 2 [Acidobacteriota bacterium]|nr:penicillin-binding protein 2 [Acidobacteriota bacterium]
MNAERVGENREHLVGRLRLLIGALVLFHGFVLAGFWVVQIVHGEQYRSLSENNRLRRQPVEALRGLIYDRNGHLLVENVPSYDLQLDRNHTRDLEASLRFAAGILETSPEELAAALERPHPGHRFAPVTVAENLSMTQLARIEAAGLEHPEFQIQVRQLRLYRYGPTTAHVLGYLGEVTEEELARADSTYEPGDLIGRRGIERTYDAELRGEDGERVVVVDSRGKLVEEFGREPSTVGSNLHLTLDLELQQEAMELLRDQVGAVVALDPRDGGILALASSPSYDPNLFSRRLQADQWRTLLEAPHDPLQTRPIQNTYSPGSVFKIVLGLAGLNEGAVSPQDRVFCGGAVRFYNHRFRCWRRAGHGWVNLEEAIQKSCDIYFYDLGQRLGIQRIARFAERFGLGQLTHIDLSGEKEGVVPDKDWSLRVRRSPWFPGETISVAIGQGPLLTTPLQVARMMAMVANDGRPVTPHLRLDQALPRVDPVDLDRRALERVQRALWMVVNDINGTGRSAAVEGLDVAGKTGTVQVVAQRTWTDNSELPEDQRDHAWFASYAPFDDPRLVVVVFVEHGGKGSQAAAPIARALYEKYFQDQLRPAAAG